MDLSLKEHDEELYNLIDKEDERQRDGIELIASENFTTKAVMECLGSVLTNKYSEGLPEKRYYGGNEFIDKIENMCIQRALLAFKLDPAVWAANVQSYSGSVANLAILTGMLNPHDRIMGLSLSHGGHLSHGFYNKGKRITASSLFFESLPYYLGEDGRINYDELEKTAKSFLPRMIICGASAYSRDYDYARFRSIADSIGAYLFCDMAHTSGLIASGVLASPFEYCDVVMTTTHKSLGGPRSALIFCKKEFKDQIDKAVFPALQGGPHNHQIAAVATQLKLVMSDQFKTYAIKVVKNCQAISHKLISHGYKVMTDGTDNHLILVDLRPMGISGGKVEAICERVGITLNKNSVVGDKSMMSPGGVRIGTCAMTTRGLDEDGAIIIADLFDETVKLGLNIQKECGKKLSEFKKQLTVKNEELDNIERKVKIFSKKFEWY